MSRRSLIGTTYVYQTIPPVRTILNIHWSDFITNIEVHEKAKITSIEAVVLKSQLRLAGHISWMRNHRPSKMILVIATEEHKRNNSRTAWKKNFATCNVDHYRCPTLTETRLTTNHDISFSETPVELLSRIKVTRRRTATVPSSPDLTFSNSCSCCKQVCTNQQTRLLLSIATHIPLRHSPLPWL